MAIYTCEKVVQQEDKSSIVAFDFLRFCSPKLLEFGKNSLSKIDFCLLPEAKRQQVEGCWPVSSALWQEVIKNLFVDFYYLGKQNFL